MTKPITFRLRDEGSDQDLGTISFNGKFIFELNSNVPHDYWDKVGFIPLASDSDRTESDDLFSYLNSRLPIDLRKNSAEDKLRYISESGLRVVSDSLVLIPA